MKRLRSVKERLKYSKQIRKFFKVLSNVWQYLQNCVRAALEKDDQQYLKDIEADLKKQINDAPKRTIDELLGAVNSNSFFLAQNFGAESYIPKYAQEKFYFN